MLVFVTVFPPSKKFVNFEVILPYFACEGRGREGGRNGEGRGGEGRGGEGRGRVGGCSTGEQSARAHFEHS